MFRDRLVQGWAGLGADQGGRGRGHLFNGVSLLASPCGLVTSFLVVQQPNPILPWNRKVGRTLFLVVKCSPLSPLSTALTYWTGFCGWWILALWAGATDCVSPSAS